MNRSAKELAELGHVPPVRVQSAASVVDFSQRGDDCCASPRPEQKLDLEDILKSVRETAYRWDFASDRIDWAENAPEVLGISEPLKLGKGRAFALLVDPEHAGSRYDGITGGAHVQPGTEVRYCLHYRFLPEGRRGRAALWIEDSGVCFIDEEFAPQACARHASGDRRPAREAGAAALSRQP